MRCYHRVLSPVMLLLLALQAAFLVLTSADAAAARGVGSSSSSSTLPAPFNSPDVHPSKNAVNPPPPPAFASSSALPRRRWTDKRAPSSTTSYSASAKTDSRLLQGVHGTRSITSIGTGILLPLFLLLQPSHSSPFDPHPLPLLLGLCFFNGWYIRVTDHKKHLAFALIVGSFKHPGANSYTEHYVALVYSDKQGNMHTAHAFPDPDSVTIDMDSEGYVGVPSNFTWRSEEVGELHIGGNEGHFDFTLPGIAAVATFHDRVPWCEKRPEMGGPEGWLGSTPLLPCHYFVHSLASRTTYRLRLRNKPSSSSSSPPSPPPSSHLSGQGYAHMESNYGNHFPSGWLWCNAISPQREVKLLMVGGKFEIGPTAPTTWIVAFRSPRFEWTFRTTDLDKVTARLDYSTRTLRLEARSRCGRRRIEVMMVAPPGSFGPPLYVPTRGGFSCLPGCRESFTATAHIKAVDEGGRGGGRRIVLEEVCEVPLAALELGGALQRL